jgi:hypothetical protein
MYSYGISSVHRKLELKLLANRNTGKFIANTIQPRKVPSEVGAD